VLAPACALADERDLVLALAHEHPLDERREWEHVAVADLAQRRPPVAEDSGVAVLLGAERATHAHVLEDALQDPHRVHLARVLRIRLDAVELGLRAHALDFELRNEDGGLACDVDGERKPAARSRGT